QFLIPTGHSATLTWLLSIPPIRSVLGDLPKSYFYELEQDTALPPPLDITQSGQIDWPALEPDRLRGLADAYFEHVAAHLPLLGRDNYERLQDEVLRNGPSQDIDTAICLSVWALGCIASNSGVAAVPESSSTDPNQDLGLSYFAIALRITLSKSVWGFTANLHTCQALVLAGVYFCYLGRPLHAWKMIHNAGQKLLERINKIIGSLYSPDNVDITLLAELGPVPNNTSLNQLITLSSELNRQLEQ
ncbi:hypothetical protein M406DRAFT_240758, partial [Cryphonectria parasitica EP155]